MKKSEFLAIGLMLAVLSGCASISDEENADKAATPNMTADLNLGDKSDAILSKYGKPLLKTGRIDSDGKKLEEWSYKDALLSFKEGNLEAFKPK